MTDTPQALFPPALTPPRALLVVGHPGHELRLYGWMRAARPDVAILTDGSGSIGQPRVSSSQRLLDAVGARATPLFGGRSDQDVYAALLAQDAGFFAAWFEALVQLLDDGGYVVVVSDPLEGYNPTHDVCSVLVSVALEQRRRRGLPVPTRYDYALTAPLATAEVEASLGERWLDDKIAAARGYPELQWEIDQAVAREGAQAFAREQLRRLETPALAPAVLPPGYETYGEQKRAAGVYRDVIRHDQHFAPMVAALIAKLPPEPRG